MALTTRQVDAIRTKYNDGTVTQQKLARKYNVTQSHISRIVNFQRRVEG